MGEIRLGDVLASLLPAPPSHPAFKTGYAAAKEALVSVLFVILTGWMLDYAGVTLINGTYLSTRAQYLLPVIVPLAFICAAVTDSLLPTSLPHYGGIMGVISVVLTYATAIAAIGLGYAAAAELALVSHDINTALSITAVYGYYMVLLTFWFTLPIGYFRGRHHHQNRLKD